MFDLTGKNALITGATGGIGEEIARALHGAGATVAISGTRAEKLEGLAADLGERVHVVAANLSDRESVDGLVKAASDAMGGVDILVNNAGISSRETLMNVTDEEWDAVFDINLKGLVMCSQYAAKQMIAQGDGGAIVNLSSSTGLNANVSRGPYSVSKAGVIMATNLLAKELGEHSITVNALAPGFTSTAKIGGRDGQMFYRGAGETEKVLAKLALQRQGEPVDYANAVVYLASELGSYVTGTTIPVDGGFTIR